MNGLKYPLEQLMSIKIKRFEQAVKVLEEKTELLLKEQEKLKKCEKERDEVKKHHLDKLTQLRQSLDKGTTSDKIEQMKIYLNVVKERLILQEKKVEEQKQEVKKAQKAFDMAKKELFDRKKDVEKLKIHRQEWEKELQMILARQESLELDELGANIFELRKKEAKKEAKKKSK
jgi:hypothetical protein